MVDLANSPSKGPMVDLVSSPTKRAHLLRYTRGEKTRAQKNLMLIPFQSELVKSESMETNEVGVLFNDKVLKKMQVYFMLGSFFNFFFFFFYKKITKYIILHKLLFIPTHI